MVLAEAQTQPDDMAVDKVTDTAGAPASHLSKKMTVETGEDGVRAGCPQKVDAYEKTVIEDRTKNFTSDDPMGRTEARQESWSEAQGSRMVIDQNKDMLQQVSMLCSVVQHLSRQMQE